MMLKWTKEKPKEDGWYWHREHAKYVPVILFIDDGDVCEILNDTFCCLDAYNGEWAGPLKPPED